MDRRGFLAGVAAGAVVVGFDLGSRQWVRVAEAAEGPVEPLPDLDGVVVMDDATLTADSVDEGNIVRRRPWAVLRPGSVEDIAQMVRFSARNGLSVAARGTAHTVFGQSLVEAGLVVETQALATIHQITPDRADVDAGVHWKDLFAATVQVGLTPPIFTGYTDMTVGGTLSVGGVGIGPREGVQVDRVRELEVVTGDGQVRWCSETSEPDLFHGVLAGVGQLGIMTRAILDLVPAPARVRSWSLIYTNPRTFFTDLRTVLARNEFDTVHGQFAFPLLALLIDPSPLLRPLSELFGVLEVLTSTLAQGIGSVVSVPRLPLGNPWTYVLNVAKYYDPGQQPDGGHLLRGLSDNRFLRQSLDRPYLEYVYRIDVLAEFLKASGLWNGVPRPWIDVFLPGEQTERFVTQTVSQLKFDDMGLAGFGLLFPIHRDQLSRRFFAVPESADEWIYLFDVLTSAPLPGPNTAFVQEKLQRNRQIYERARDVGGKLYPISASPMAPADWATQYGPRYAEFAQLKQQFDPDGILTPGLQLF